MRIIKDPSEPIFADAYSIASAMIRRQAQEIFRDRAIKSNNLKRADYLSSDIDRLDDLIQDRINAWVANYGTQTTWKQYLADFPRYDTIQKILEVAA